MSKCPRHRRSPEPLINGPEGYHDLFACKRKAMQSVYLENERQALLCQFIFIVPLELFPLIRNENLQPQSS